MRRRHLATALLLVGALSACHVAIVPATLLKKTDTSASSSPSTHPVATSSVAGATGATPAPVSLLLPPKGAGAALTGTLGIDSSYTVADGAGAVLGDGANTFLAVGKGSSLSGTGSSASLVGDAGGSVLALGSGGNIISNNSSGLISDAGGGALADNGAGIVANNGGNLIANNGGSLISNNGGGLIGKTRYHVLAAPATPAFGQQNPAAGMEIQLVDLTTGRALPIGVNAAGKAVYGAYTNLTGGYKVYVPAGQSANVRLVARAPGNSDPRLQYDLVTPQTATAAVPFDEDTAEVTRILRLSLREKFNSVLELAAKQPHNQLPTADQLAGFLGSSNISAQNSLLIVPLLSSLITEIQANALITPADYGQVGYELGDVLLAHMPDLSTMPITADGYAPERSAIWSVNPNHALPVLPALVAVMRDFRQGVIAQGKGLTPGQVAVLFASKPYLKRSNDFHARVAPNDPAPYYVIEKPGDLVDFMSLEYFPLVSNQPYLCAAGDVCASRADIDQSQFDMGIFPKNGIAAVQTYQIADLTRAVESDLAVQPGDSDVLSAATSTCILNLLFELVQPDIKAQLDCTLHNYKLQTPDCVATPAS